MTAMETGEWARLLREMARPFVGDCPDLALQKAMVEALEGGIKKDTSHDKHVMFVGAFELPVIPASQQDFDQIKLVDLPSNFEADGTLAHSLPGNLNGFELVEAIGIQGQLVRFSLLTMNAARQLDYLRRSGFVGKGWKVVVEIHYYRRRQTVVKDILHKDTYGQTLFVNLNYDTEVDIPGPEYILNPAVVDEHEAQIVLTLPEKFMDDLRWVRGQLGRPTEISIATVKPKQFVAFVDEAIHHMSPQLGGRTVTSNQLLTFLGKTYSEKHVQDAKAARKAFRSAPSTIKGMVRALHKSPKPFSQYLKVIQVDQVMWFNLMELAETPNAVINRLALTDARLRADLIDELLDENWEGYSNVSIPGAGTAPLAEGKLKRQASRDALTGPVPAPTTDDRRFFRTWVRVIKL